MTNKLSLTNKYFSNIIDVIYYNSTIIFKKIDITNMKSNNITIQHELNMETYMLTTL